VTLSLDKTIGVFNEQKLIEQVETENMIINGCVIPGKSKFYAIASMDEDCQLIEKSVTVLRETKFKD
jgi:hypothetical protein